MNPLLVAEAAAAEAAVKRCLSGDGHNKKKEKKTIGNCGSSQLNNSCLCNQKKN